MAGQIRNRAALLADTDLQERGTLYPEVYPLSTELCMSPASSFPKYKNGDVNFSKQKVS